MEGEEEGILITAKKDETDGYRDKNDCQGDRLVDRADRQFVTMQCKGSIHKQKKSAGYSTFGVIVTFQYSAS